MKPFINIAAMLVAVAAVFYLFSQNRGVMTPLPAKYESNQEDYDNEAPVDSCAPSCTNKKCQCCKAEKV